MVNKPTLTKEQAEAIKKAKREGEEDRVLTVVASSDNSWAYGLYTHLNDLPVRDLSIALYVGYEVEKSPKEKVKEYYETLDPEKAHDDDRWRLRMEQRKSVRNTLDLLGIKIEGVNV